MCQIHIKDKKTELIVHWHSDIINQKLIYPLFSFLEKRILTLADCIFVTSPNYLENSAPLKPFKEKCSIVPNGIYESKIKFIPNDTTIKNIKKFDLYTTTDLGERFVAKFFKNLSTSFIFF